MANRNLKFWQAKFKEETKFEGRLGRKQFLRRMLPLAVADWGVHFLIQYSDKLFSTGTYLRLLPDLIILALAFGIVVYKLALLSRRLHDCGYPMAWSLVAWMLGKIWFLEPFIIALMWYLKGDKEANKYGEPQV